MLWPVNLQETHAWNDGRMHERYHTLRHGYVIVYPVHKQKGHSGKRGKDDNLAGENMSGAGKRECVCVCLCLCADVSVSVHGGPGTGTCVRVHVYV